MSFNNLVHVKEIENAVLRMSDHIENNERHQTIWNNIPENELWVALVACILGSRVRYETVNSCVQHLYKCKLLNPTKLISNPRKYRRVIEHELSQPIFLPHNGNGSCKYRYSRSKSDYIVRSALQIYKENNSNLKELLMDCQEEYEARVLLTERVLGLGYKQASLFLRNICYSENLAILDSHVIRYMMFLNLIEKDAKLATKKDYIKFENILQNYADLNNQSLSDLDIAIWIVMRLIQKEFVVWK